MKLLGLIAFAIASVAHADTTLVGSGSTFQKAYHEVAIDAYAKQTGVAVLYGGGGSGKGRQDLADMVVDFAGTDAPFKDADLVKIKGGDVLYFPVILGAITVSYNLDTVGKLKLSPETIAKIFQRDIVMWNDKAIAADNPRVSLPAMDIIVVHRADGSSTTDNFTKYLADAAGSTWKLKTGAMIDWPDDTQSGNGNSGVAQVVKATKGAIGFVDLPDAKAAGLRYASIKNKAGKFVEPSPASASAAANGATVDYKLLFTAANAKGEAAYPITYQSWLIVYATQADAEKGALMKAYVKFLVGDGQKLLPALDLGPLPKGLQALAFKQLNALR